ncbi:MAG: SET domain-containing protein-lysine N-methyltransferase [Chloroflexota bacterium]|jgi:hypothetical protein
MEIQSFSYCSPKLELRPCPEKGGFGLFAIESVPAGELLSMWGGQVVMGDQLNCLPVERQTHGIQIHEDLYLIPVTHGEPADYFNHSCNPNSGLDSPISLVAMRDIEIGEEVCFDYAMSDSSDYDEFECQCGASNCRRTITGKDWMNPELQQRYFGFFSPYLQRRIAKILHEAKSNNNGRRKHQKVTAAD